MNAIQHSGSQKKTQVRAFSQKNECVIQVRDFGKGIPPKDLAHIFERFYRADKVRAESDSTEEGARRAGSGSGLGLAIVKHIALAHGGSVQVESWANEGTLFELRIPDTRVHESDRTTATA